MDDIFYLRNALRPPDWRYQRALRLVQEGRHLSPRHYDATTRAIAEQLRARQRKGVSAVVGSQGDIDLRAAMHIYFSTLPLRAVIEALVLAGEAPTSIATHVGVSARAIEWYETAFFDVRDRLSAPAFIVHRVIAGAAAQSGSAPFMHVWKTAAYLGGASVLHVLLGIQKVDGLEQLLAHQRQQIRAGLQQQLLATASVLAADNPVAGARLLQLVDAGKGKAHEENSLNEFEENVRQMLAHLHFSVGEPEANNT